MVERTVLNHVVNITNQLVDPIIVPAIISIVDNVADPVDATFIDFIIDFDHDSAVVDPFDNFVVDSVLDSVVGSDIIASEFVETSAKSFSEEGSIDIDVVEDAFEQGWNPPVGPVVFPISDNLSELEKCIMAQVVDELHDLFDGSLGLA